MKEKLHQIKLVMCEETAESAVKNDVYVFVKKTSIAASSFVSSFREDPGIVRDLSLVITGSIEDEIEEHKTSIVDRVTDKDLFLTQFKEAKSKFFELIRGKKGLPLCYSWSTNGDFDQIIISLMTIDQVALGLIHKNTLIREVAKASH